MSDDMKMEDITPEMLGCLGEKEIDDGVKEEVVASGETKVPVPKSFEHIPLEVKKRAHKLYETFEGAAKDMSFEDFCVALYALESPALMGADLQGIVEQKHSGYRRKAAVDHTMNRMN